MIHTSIASSLQAPIKTKQIDIKMQSSLRLASIGKICCSTFISVLSTGYLTLVLAYNLLQLRPKFGNIIILSGFKMAHEGSLS
jgi:ABC-type thiamin/hydroxymethylpyrimidine transport system permease subunit